MQFAIARSKKGSMGSLIQERRPGSQTARPGFAGIINNISIRISNSNSIGRTTCTAKRTSTNAQTAHTLIL
jgi:hypothetical protein